MKRLIILGGGYGGSKLIHQLLPHLDKDVEIKLIDRNPYHSMKTEFYALAAGTVAEREIRSVFPKHDQLQLVVDEILSVDLENKGVHLRHHDTIYYDYLVVALGSEDAYHGTEGAKEHALSIGTIKKSRQTYEAVNNVDSYGMITVVGGGLSGVEVASELRESRPDLNIRLLDHGSSILRTFPEDIQKYATEWFKENDVEIVTNSHIDYVEPEVVCNSGITLLTNQTIWTAGIKPNRIVDRLNAEKDTRGYLKVDEFYRVVGQESVFAIGDSAESDYPQSGQLAEQQGKQLASILECLFKGKDPKIPGPIKIKGTLGSLGEHDGFGLTFNKGFVGALPRVIKSGILWYHKFKL
jgi:NADH:ubiquinone reductase (H+-translocating)